MTELIAGIEERLEAVRLRLDAAEKPFGPVKLLAVSKTFPKEAVLIATQCGQRAFGENYVQEGTAKVEWFRKNHPELSLEWHFIGPLQANKTRLVAEHFDWVESIDRLRVAERLSAQRPAAMPPLNVLIEVNIDAEPSKSGVAPEALEALAEGILKLPNLQLRGLMAIPAPAEGSEAKKRPLMAMRRLFDQMKGRFGFDTLSMGMSGDMLEAIEAGSTLVRVGSAIFGARDYSQR